MCLITRIVTLVAMKQSSYTIIWATHYLICFILVTDTEAPNITCVEYNSIPLWQMTATDNSGDVPKITCYQPSTATVSTGQTTVMCEAIDTNENRAECYLQANTTGKLTYLLLLLLLPFFFFFFFFFLFFSSSFLFLFLFLLLLLFRLLLFSLQLLHVKQRHSPVAIFVLITS